MLPYLVLLRMGFTVPSAVTVDAVSSYLAVSPLPVRLATPSAVCSLLHFPSPCGAQPLAGILPCGARTFLPRIAPAAGSRTPLTSITDFRFSQSVITEVSHIGKDREISCSYWYRQWSNDTKVVYYYKNISQEVGASEDACNKRKSKG